MSTIRKSGWVRTQSVVKSLRGSANVGLTHSEALVAELLVQGLTKKEICDRLCVGIKTVDFHLLSMYRMYDIKSSLGPYASGMNALREVFIRDGIVRRSRYKACK